MVFIKISIFGSSVNNFGTKEIWRIIKLSFLSMHSAPGPTQIFFLDTTSIDKKSRYSLKKLPGSWKNIFFYFEHCVSAISKWHLPTCRAEIGEFHSIKCLFWTPIFFMITVFHTMTINTSRISFYWIFWKYKSLTPA